MRCICLGFVRSKIKSIVKCDKIGISLFIEYARTNSSRSQEEEKKNTKIIRIIT